MYVYLLFGALLHKKNNFPAWKDLVSRRFVREYEPNSLHFDKKPFS